MNIVAIGTLPAVANRAGAAALNEAGIMLIGGQWNDPNTNYDLFAGSTSSAFFCATPRSGVQAPALDNVMPITTDPSVALTAYGVNSFYGGAAGHGAQSFAGPAAAAMAAVAVQAYQDQHSGQNPTVQQIKRAMMSGVDFVSGLDDRTVTHDYVNGERQDGGLFNVNKIISAINQTSPEITNVSMTQTSQSQLGTIVDFDLNKTGTVSNWTISWGDNSLPDGSGVEVAPGSGNQAQHTYPFENVPHHYFPTIYAMSSTKQVYLPAPSAQAEVVVSGFAPTSEQDNYTLARSGSNVILTLQNAGGTTSATFAPGDMPIARIWLDATAGDDTLTLDFTNGNPLTGTDLTVYATADNVVRVIGSAGTDTINVAGSIVTVNGSELIAGNATLYVDGAGGDDVLSVSGNQYAGPLVHFDSSQSFSEISLSLNGGIVMDADGSLVVRTETLSIATGGVIDLNDNDAIITNSSYASIASLVAAARNGGAWDGDGITSSAAANAANHATMLGVLTGSQYIAINGTTFSGFTVSNGDVLVKYTWYGDANFNGVVDFDDYARIDYGFRQGLSGWLNGDFDLSGAINFDDYALIDLAFYAQSGQMLFGGPTAWQQIAQMDHFSTSYMHYLIDEMEKHDIYLTEADFLPVD